MVKAIVNLNERANRVINIVKAKYGLRDKSEAINKLVLDYEKVLLEPALRPEFVEKMKKRENEKAMRVDDFSKRYGLE